MTLELYAPYLGKVTAEQLQKALSRFQLGELLGAEVVRFGNFGQNIFVSSTKGEFVLRGKPLFPGQFMQESWFMQKLYERTTAPVPWPYLLDRLEDIFGWSYILMLRMPGQSLIDPIVKQGLNEQERSEIAQAFGTTLAHLHALDWPCAGHYDPAIDTIQPFAGSYSEQLIADIRQLLEAGRRATARTTVEDIAWVDALIAQGKEAFDKSFQPRFIMGDYKETNVVVEHTGATWRVSGVFDIHGSFGDREADLSRPIACYIDEDTPYLAQEFLRAYQIQRPLRPGFRERFPLHMLKERLAIWEWAQRINNVWWQPDLTLREWATPFIEAMSWLS